MADSLIADSHRGIKSHTTWNGCHQAHNRNHSMGLKLTKHNHQQQGSKNQRKRNGKHTEAHTLRWNVPSNAATITILPALAAASQNGIRSVKNWPSSMPTTSNSRHMSPRSLNFSQGTASSSCLSCVATQDCNTHQQIRQSAQSEPGLQWPSQWRKTQNDNHTHLTVSRVLIEFHNQSGLACMTEPTNAAQQIAGFAAEHGPKSDVNRSGTRTVSVFNGSVSHEEATAAHGHVHVVTTDEFYSGVCCQSFGEWGIITTCMTYCSKLFKVL